MPKYTPIEAPKIRSSLSDLAHFKWIGRSIVADFSMPDDEGHLLRVQFDKAEVVRILDEMPLSTEAESTPNEGLVKDHFAYSVEGAAFWQYQSDALKSVYPRLRHFRFVTGWTCIDILSDEVPAFLVMPATEGQCRPNDAQIDAAARILDQEGRFHGWWPKHIATYDNLDPIARDEFEAIVERLLIAAKTPG
jgi:hypothetical protein